MVKLQRRVRTSAVLTPSKLPCLGKTPTVNITEGCAHGCCYCYARGYSQYPGVGCVRLFENTPDLIRDELRRKRRRPQRVYFSPSSDAFQPIQAVLDVTYACMEILLQAGIEVAFLTKGAVPREFLALFAEHQGKVFGRIGISTLDETISTALEPHAAAPARRLQCIEELAAVSVAISARMDPLIPDLTDRADRVEVLLKAFARRGVRTVAASYLFLRPAFASRVTAAIETIADEGFSMDAWQWRQMAAGVGSGHITDADDRTRRFTRLAEQAARHGIDVHVCACKNPDVPMARNCRIAGPETPSGGGKTMPLFDGVE